MTKGQSHEGACIGKHPYPSGALAWSVARKMGGGSISAYRCTYCHQWHVGSRARRIRKEDPVTHSPTRPSASVRRRKRVGKATAWAVKAHAKCQSDAEKAAILDVFVKRIKELDTDAQADR